MNANPFDRIGLVVHPRRELGNALATVREWAERQGAEVVQVRSPGHVQEVAPPGEVGACDLVIALGGDGTTLAALRAAAPAHRPVLGVACGSLGALTAVTADRLSDALDHVARGDYAERRLPALIAEHRGGELTALNDLVLVRDGAGQVMFELEVDGERFIRLAGDGVVAATPLGSSAYTLAAGGPLLARGATGSWSRRWRRTAASARRSSPAPRAASTITARLRQRRRARRARRPGPPSSSRAPRSRSRCGSSPRSPRSSRSARRRR